MGKIQKEALAHYNRMIAWAEKQDPYGGVYSGFMRNEIGEGWFGDYCVYCEKYYHCDECPLNRSGRCCDGLWKKMSASETWGDWIINAKKVRQYIKENGG
jgi:hypothetical protein